MQVADFYAQSFGFEPVAFAGVARNVGEVARDLLARPVAVGLAVAPLEIGDHAFEWPPRVIGAHAVVIGETDLGIAGAVKDRVLRFLRQVLPLGIEREAVVFAERLQGLDVVRRARFGPGRYGAPPHGAVLVGNDQIRVDMLLDAKPAAFWAGAERIVERKQPRLDFRDGEARHRASKLFRKYQPARVGCGCGRELGLLLGRLLALLLPPLWGRVVERGVFSSASPLPALCAGLPHKGGRRISLARRV